MVAPETYAQCQLRCGARVTYGWIPASAARQGVHVRLVDLDDSIWCVTEVYSLRVAAADVHQRERGYKDFQGSTRGGGIDA